MEAFNENEIDAFLLGYMEESKLKAFENKMAGDHRFFMEVKKQREAIQLIRYLGAWETKKRLQALHKELFR